MFLAELCSGGNYLLGYRAWVQGLFITPASLQFQETNYLRSTFRMYFIMLEKRNSSLKHFYLFIIHDMYDQWTFSFCQLYTKTCIWVVPVNIVRHYFSLLEESKSRIFLYRESPLALVGIPVILLSTTPTPSTFTADAPSPLAGGSSP